MVSSYSKVVVHASLINVDHFPNRVLCTTINQEIINLSTGMMFKYGFYLKNICISTYRGRIPCHSLYPWHGECQDVRANVISPNEVLLYSKNEILTILVPTSYLHIVMNDEQKFMNCTQELM